MPLITNYVEYTPIEGGRHYGVSHIKDFIANALHSSALPLLITDLSLRLEKRIIMTNTDRILISKDKYLHLGLCETRIHLSGIFMNELVPIEEAFLQHKKQLLAYIDNRIDQQEALTLLKNATEIYEEIYVINLEVNGKNSQSGMKKIPLSQYNNKCKLNERIKLKKDIERYNEFHDRYNVKLTRTENEIMLHILKGEGVCEISSALNCSKKVIYAHKYNIIKKYGFRTFNELYIKILQKGHE